MKKPMIVLLLLFTYFISPAQKKDKRKDKDKEVTQLQAPAPPDTLHSFTGLIKYQITNDDPADRDSMYIIFGKKQIRVTLFYAGKKENEITQDNMIADFNNNTLLFLDTNDSTYKIDNINRMNKGTVFSLDNDKKTGLILKNACMEFGGSMKTKEGDEFEASCLVSKQHSYAGVPDYNFLNIHPLVMENKIVLGFRTRSSDNENTYIVAYKIEPGNTDRYFDLGKFRIK